MKSLRIFVSRNTGAVRPLPLYLFYSELHPKGFTVDLFVQNSNEASTLILLSWVRRFRFCSAASISRLAR